MPFNHTKNVYLTSTKFNFLSFLVWYCFILISNFQNSTIQFTEERIKTIRLC